MTNSYVASASPTPRLLIVSHWDVSWAAHYIYKGLKSAFDHVDVLCPPDPTNPTHDLSLGYRVFRVPLHKPGDYLSGFDWPALARTIAKLDPDVILAFTEPTNSYVLQLAMLKKLNVIRGKLLFYGFENLTVGDGRRNRFLVKPLWRYIDGGAMASTEAVDALYRSGFPKSHPLRLVPYGTDCEEFKPLDKAECRAHFRIRGEKVAGFVGRLVVEKGIGDLIDTVKSLPDYHLCIAGDGPERAKIEQLIRDENLTERVQLIGNVFGEQVPHLLPAFDLLVLPSRTTGHWKEQWGRVLVEAMACGVPVIGSSSGAIPEVIGDAGLTFPEGDTAALAQKIDQIMAHSAVHAELRDRGLKRARTVLSTQAMGQALLSLAREVSSTP